MGSIRQKVHDDGALLDGLLDREEGLTRHPAISLGLLPALTVLADTDNNVEAVVAGVETLAMTLRAIANESEGVVLEVVLELG